MKKIRFLTILSSAVLFACGVEEDATEEKPIDEELEQTIPETEEIEEESLEEAVANIDFDTGDIEEIPWDEIELSKGQFDDFLMELPDDTFDFEGADEKIEFEIQSLDFDGELIEFTLIDNGMEDVMAEFVRSFYIFMVDSYSRQFYLSSDYSDGDTQPKIIFYDKMGEIITENDEFIEIEE